MSKDAEQEKREVLALVSWLQTFDKFPFSVVDGIDGENVTERFNIALESLENCKISRAVVHVAEEICETGKIDVGVNPSADEIWRALLHIATTRSRFEIYTTPSNVNSNAEIPHVVLSNLLDFAVTSPDLDERRKYIQRIMSLSKSVQKILMNLIERMKKTLPRKPKNATTSQQQVPSSQLPKSVRSPRNLCGPRHEELEGPDAAIPNSVKKSALPNNPRALGDDDGSESSSVDTPPRESPQRLHGFGSPKRERNVHGIPQSEPRPRARSLSRERGVLRAPNSEQKPPGRSSSRTRHRQHESEELQAAKPRQPEGYFLSERDKKRCHKGFVSPPRDRGQQPQQRKLKGFTSPSKQRHSTGSAIGQAPLRERQVQAQRAAFVSINNQSAAMHGLGGKKNFSPGAPPPPPPPPPYPAADQKMPASSTPSDELEFDNHMSFPLTNPTNSTADSSQGTTSTELAILKLNSSVEKPRPTGKVISIDNKKRQEGFASPQRRSLLDSPGRAQTPEASIAMYERDIDSSRMLFSPDDSMLQSPMQVDDFVKELRAKNKSLESILQSYQKRERELSQKMETTESKLRKEMMKLESRALGREDELRHNYENEMAKLKKDLRTEKERSKERKRAQEELASANDELDLMHHTQGKLLEAMEKIRKYKERLDSQKDFKEALERERHAHNESVDECVHLRNELKTLLPLKRQLEDYKAKAVETEVQLAECRDALARLERERDELDGARNDVLKAAKTQKAQAEELRKFIRLEEKHDGPGIGEGISELNPELAEELIKLRNENEKLRAFADQRTDDSVQKLHENLEDSTVRQERFKEEYLKSKNKLEDTQSLLAEAKQKLAELEAEIEQKDKKAEEYEQKIKNLEDQYTACLEDLEGLQEQIEQIEEEKTILERDVAEWKEMADKLEIELKKRSGELDGTKIKLEAAEESNKQLETDVAEWKLMTDKLETELLRRVKELETTKESLDASETEKARVASDLAEWKQMATKLETELVKKNEDLEASRKSLMSMEQEKTSIEGDLAEWKQIAAKLEEELNSTSSHLDETNIQLRETKDALREAGQRQAELLNRVEAYENQLEEKELQLRETGEALHDAGQRQEELLNRIDGVESRLREKEDENETLSKTLKDTCQAMKATEASLEDAWRREVTLNEERQEMKEVSEKLVNQLKEEKKAKKAMIEENHKTLEATREVLNSKAKKDMEELQENMNKLLNDERKAYRVKNEKQQHDSKKRDEKYARKMLEVNEDASATVKACQEDCHRRMEEQEAQHNLEIETIKRNEKMKRDNLVEKTEQMIEESKANAKAAMLEQEKEKMEVIENLKKSQEREQQLANKSASYKKKLENATRTVNDLEAGEDDLRQNMKQLERQKEKVEEENERYRRQLGGRYGADGQMQNQVDKLNKELMDAHNENRDLKRKLAARTSAEDMSMSFDVDSSQTGYSRGSVNSHAIAQIRQGYEEQLANLNDEKRELVMKNSAAITDVQKAEQVAWDREQEIARLKAEKTSLELQLQRAQLASSAAEENMDSSFYSHGNNMSFSTKELSFVADHTHNAEQEICNNKADERALSPIKAHDIDSTGSGFTEEESSTQSSPRSRKTNPYELHLRDMNSSPKRPMAEKSNPYDFHRRDVIRKPERRQSDEQQREQQQQREQASLMNYTQMNTSEADEAPDCQQS